MSEWRNDMESAPRDKPFLAYGSYLYPGDKGVTEYTEVIEYSGDSEWPWEGMGGKCKPEVFSHWMPLPPPPLDNTSKSAEEDAAYSDAHRAATVPAVPPDQPA